MLFYCLKDFKDERDRLVRKNSYKNLDESIIQFIEEAKSDPSQLKTGRNLNRNPDRPYVKKRLEGRGGYRLYHYYLVIEGCVFLLFIHPKTGTFGSENIEVTYKTNLLSKVQGIIKNKDWKSLFEVKIEKKKLLLEKLEKFSELEKSITKVSQKIKK